MKTGMLKEQSKFGTVRAVGKELIHLGVISRYFNFVSSLNFLVAQK